MNAGAGRWAVLLAAPAALLFLLFFAAPFLTMAAMSLLTDNPLVSDRAGLTLRHYARMTEDTYDLEILWAMLRLGLWTTLVSLLLGHPLALPIARVRSGTARTLLLMAVIAALAHIDVSFMILTLTGVVARIDLRLEDAARGLGATPAVAFGEVTRPLIRPGVIAGALFAFTLSFDQFPVSLFRVSPGNETLPIAMFNRLRSGSDGTIAAASSVPVPLAALVALGSERTIGLQDCARL
ncbi:MAG: hypothetical protein N2Z67_11330 [Acetobacteraceae bacterium]|nr:hypothetical protein [Acetobacteraceae bacterium]